MLITRLIVMYRNDYAHNDGIDVYFEWESGWFHFWNFQAVDLEFAEKDSDVNEYRVDCFHFSKIIFLTNPWHISYIHIQNDSIENQITKVALKSQTSSFIIMIRMKFGIPWNSSFPFCKDSPDRFQRAETIYWFWWKWIESAVDRFSLDTYTSTKTGKAASRNSSRQLGGYRTWTCTRVPCCKVISNDCFFGSASLSRRCRIDEFPILNSSCSNILVLIECTPAMLRNAKAKQLKQLKCWTKHRRRKEKKNRTKLKNNTVSALSSAHKHTYNRYIMANTNWFSVTEAISEFNCALKNSNERKRQNKKYGWIIWLPATGSVGPWHSRT